MPSRSTIMGILWTLGVIAVVSRVPVAKSFLFNGGL